MSGYERRGGGKNRRFKKRDNNDKPSKSDNATRDTDPDSVIVAAFRGFQQELDCRNDRFERIVKLSRDITIDSKRVIFLLQRVTGSDNAEQLLKEAEDKIDEINKTKFYHIAKELDGQDPYQFLRAYTNGLQEYIEAVAFLHYLRGRGLVPLPAVQAPLVFPRPPADDPNPTKQTEESSNAELNKAPTTETPSSSLLEVQGSKVSETKGTEMPKDSDEELKTVVLEKPEAVDSVSNMKPQEVDSKCNKSSNHIAVHIPPTEYVLGVADFTGELMRLAITSVGVGDLETPRVVAGVMREIHDCVSLVDRSPRELKHKAKVLRQSLFKVERACYTLTVRGSEIPKHMLTDVFHGMAQADEGFHGEEQLEFD